MPYRKKHKPFKWGKGKKGKRRGDFREDSDVLLPTAELADQVGLKKPSVVQRSHRVRSVLHIQPGRRSGGWIYSREAREGWRDYSRLRATKE